MQKTFPAIRPYATHELAVSEPHVLYVEESGSKDGIPVIVCHGGPGAGSKPIQRQYFDPSVYRIILFDQRGCGKSKPSSCLQDNTTSGLIADMEVIREHLGIEKWVLFGGSWGAALALLYAQAYPKRVLGLVLRSILLANQNDIDWSFSHDGASRFFPEFWQEFVGGLRPSEREDVVAAFYRRLQDDNDLAKMKVAKAWSLWHRRRATLNPTADSDHAATGTMRLALIECHYYTNQCFIAENQILDNMDKLKGIPAIIVHGRYDMITPLDNAASLIKNWKQAKLKIVHLAGHASTDVALTDALVKSTEEMSKMVGDNPPPIRLA